MSASDKIARLRELQAKASDVEWKVERCAVWCGSVGCDKCWAGPGTWHVGSGYSPEDAAAIVAAMNSLPALLECADVLQKLAQVAMTSGGTAGPDARLIATVAQATHALQALTEGGGE